MSRQFYKRFFITIWLGAALISAPAQEPDSISHAPAGADATEQTTADNRIYPAGVSSSTVKHVPDSESANLKEQEAFRYANDPAFWKKEPRNNALEKAGASFFNSPLLKVVLYGLLTLAIAFVLYQVIIVNNLFIVRNGRRRKKEAAGEDLVLAAGNLEGKISEAVAQGQYRLAIRYYYLLTLRSLDERNLIRLDSRSTNYDYLAQMKGKQAAPAFGDLTRIYEYVWYGQYQPDSRQFEKIESGFTQFIASA